MDGYPMPVADLLVDAAAGHRIISFMDGNAGYNQIFMAEEDIPKTTFRCPGHVGLFKWIVMTFGLKNAGATYQRAMNFIFHEFIGKLVEIYIDDVVVKSGDFTKHLADLRKVLECTRKHGLKMNPNKCAFGVSAGQFLGFMVHQRGIEISRRSTDAINKIVAPTNKTELQSLIGKVNFIRWFISNLSSKIPAFSPLRKLKADQEFIWGKEQQLALDEIKSYLVNPPVLIPPQQGKPFRLYLSTDGMVIGLALIQEFEGKERVIYYLSRRLIDAETRYSAIEKLCLCLYFSCIKLRHYLLLAECTVICKDDVVRYMLSMPIMSGRIGKWILALSEFDLRYESAKAVKGQIMADLVTQHCGAMETLEIVPWTLFFDGSTCDREAGIGIVLISPQGRKYEFSLPIVTTSTNNQAEYQALIKGLELLKEVHADAVKIFGDSMLVINQLAGSYECRSKVLITYYKKSMQLLKEFKDFRLEHVPRLHNEEVNRLAQHASGYQLILNTISAISTDDWRKEIVDYLKDPSKKVERRVRFQATKYVLLEDELYYRTIDGVLLRCLSDDEAKSLMGEIHEGVCGAHQSAFKMKWMIRRNGYYWPTILEDCFQYFMGCQGCQKFGNIQRAPASAMNPIIKPWLFRG